MADPHIQMGEVLKEAREKTEGPAWSYPARENGFLAADDMARKASLDGCTAGPPAWARPDSGEHFIEAYKPGTVFRREEDATQQGALAPALRVVQCYMTYIAVFAAGWFACAVFQLARLKGWL